jgi:hypothetical protein
MATHRTDVGAGSATAAGRTRGYGMGRTYTETKAGFKTTEFIFAVVAIAGILIATYVGDADLGANEGWKYATWVALAYIVSRGLAKLGTREPYGDRFDEDVT